MRKKNYFLRSVRLPSKLIQLLYVSVWNHNYVCLWLWMCELDAYVGAHAQTIHHIQCNWKELASGCCGCQSNEDIYCFVLCHQPHCIVRFAALPHIFRMPKQLTREQKSLPSVMVTTFCHVRHMIKPQRRYIDAVVRRPGMFGATVIERLGAKVLLLVPLLLLAILFANSINA